jgi:hypothetical protein
VSSQLSADKGKRKLIAIRADMAARFRRIDGVRSEAMTSRRCTSTQPAMRPSALRPARGISRLSPRAELLDTASTTRQTDATDAGSDETACPYTAAKSMMSSLRSPPARPANGEDFPVYPGPGADVLRNIADVMYIGIKGMERATLYFADSYGPVARCAPATECRWEMPS